MNTCRICGRVYEDRRRKNSTCCNSCRTKIRRYRAKQAAVAYKGGKCERCGWIGDIAAYEFHHKDPSIKDFAIGNVSNRSWDLIKKEIDKCELLCSICHRIESAGERDSNFLEEVKNYHGKILK